MVEEELHSEEQQDESAAQRSVPLEEVGSERIDSPASPKHSKRVIEYWNTVPASGEDHASEPVEDDKNYVFGKKKVKDE